MLRQQTQRRLDKEMIGRELLEDDYAQEPDLEKVSFHTMDGRALLAPSTGNALPVSNMTTKA